MKISLTSSFLAIPGPVLATIRLAAGAVLVLY
jgi:hypothetical protein